ncbi:zinc finger protein 500 [Conger conger]|uniref:zinc finger protein 500 n=1 Tax=Conger conger TaxID=82655 RepID=UPI002A599820|nr:zinc finger protein 500 [Conger conger]
MSDAIVTFQSQLSGVMETVFKAAMYEITRLVEDSFLEEVSRSREQVESLKQRLQWSESRRRERESGGRTRCADCGRAGVSSEETEDRPSGTQSEVDEGRGLKQEKVPDGSWSSCPGEASIPGPTHAQEAVATPSSVGAPSGCTPTAQSELDGDRLDAMLKEEALQTAPPAGELQERWSVCLEGQEGPGGAGQDDGFGVQRLHMCEEWGSGAGPGAGHGPEAGGGEELAHAYEARYGLEEELGVALEEEPKGEYMAAMLGFPADLDPTNPAHPAVARGRRAGFPQGSSPPVTDSELDCLLINEDGFLQDADRRSRGPRRGRGRRGAERRELGGGACGTDLLPPGLDSASGGHRGAPFAPPPAPLHGCTHCRLSFPDLPALKAHLLTHAGAGAYTCTQCGKSFTQACNLKVHQRIHSGQGLHLCSHCGKGFLSFAELKRHKCSHGSEKPYCCSLCGNKFSRLWNLKLHRRIHTQEKPHRCAQCGKSFTRADILKVHHRTHTGERPYSCTICGLSFKRLDHLKSHQRKHS